MAAQAVTVNLPGPLYERLAKRATRAHRTIEAELVDAVAMLPDDPDELSADMAEAITALHLLADEEIWRAARQRLAPRRPPRSRSCTASASAMGSPRRRPERSRRS